MKGKTVLITGATSGIGLEAAVALARMGTSVVITARDNVKAEKARELVATRSGNTAVGVLTADLSIMKEVRSLAIRFLAKHNRLDVLVNNAGLFMDRRVMTAEGNETTLAVNLLAPFLLTNYLARALKKSAPSRVVMVASTAHRGAKLDLFDVQGEGTRETPGKMYGRTKKMLIMLTHEFARRLSGDGVTVNAMCPGGVSTGIWWRGGEHNWKAAVFRKLVLPLLKTPKQGSRLIVHLASSDLVRGVSGRYFETPTHLRFLPWNEKKTERKSSRDSCDREAERRLWGIVSGLTGWKGK